MRKAAIGLLVLVVSSLAARAQELYVNTEPASNMAAKSLGFRLNNKLMSTGEDRQGWRLNPEVMVGLSSKWMWHVSGYLSNLYTEGMRFEGAGTYAKYRFLADDDVHTHFRMAVYGRASLIRNPVAYQEINLEGDNSGAGVGLIATKLMHKVALSASLGYDRATDNVSGNKLPTGYGPDALTYSLSVGALVFPQVYTSYRQVNMNAFVEFLGQSNVDIGRQFLDVAPAIQFIFNSRTRVDISRRMQLGGNMSRYSKNSWLLRVEYNVFNAF